MKKHEPKKRGRPPGTGKGQTPRRSIRVSDAEWSIFQDAAKRAGKSFTEWALDLMRKASRR